MPAKTAPEPPRALPPEDEPVPSLARPRRSVYALAILVVLIATGLGWAKGAGDLRSESHTMLSEAFTALREADRDVERVDAEVSRGLTADGGDSARAAYDQVLRAREGLEEALELISEAEPEARGKDRHLARALRQSAKGRLGMIESAAALLPIQSRASDALRDTEAGWSSVKRAAVLSDQAATAFNAHTRAGVASSTALTSQAESELTSAEAAFQDASRTVPEASLEALLDLVAERRRVAAESRRIDAVWLSGGIAEANGLLAKLAAEQTQGEAKRPPLPQSAGDLVRAAYERLTTDLLEEYEGARRLADEGDSRLERLAAQPSE